MRRRQRCPAGRHDRIVARHHRVRPRTIRSGLMVRGRTRFTGRKDSRCPPAGGSRSRPAPPWPVRALCNSYRAALGVEHGADEAADRRRPLAHCAAGEVRPAGGEYVLPWGPGWAAGTGDVGRQARRGLGRPRPRRISGHASRRGDPFTWAVGREPGLPPTPPPTVAAMPAGGRPGPPRPRWVVRCRPRSGPRRAPARCPASRGIPRQGQRTDRVRGAGGSAPTGDREPAAATSRPPRRPGRAAVEAGRRPPGRPSSRPCSR